MGKNKIEVSSGNLYADLGFANPQIEQAKATLAREIRSAIDARGLTQTEAGELLGISQGDVSRITRGRLGGYSMDRLMSILTKLNIDVSISLKPSADFQQQGSISALGVAASIADQLTKHREVADPVGQMPVFG